MRAALSCAAFFISTPLSINKNTNMKITTTDKSVKIETDIMVYTGALSTFTYIYSIPVDSVTFYNEDKLIITSRLSDTTVNGTQLTADNIDTELEKVFKTPSGGSDGDEKYVLISAEPVTIGLNANTSSKTNVTIGRTASTNGGTYAVAVGEQAKASGNASVAIGRNTQSYAFGTAIGNGAQCETSTGVALGYFSKLIPSDLATTNEMVLSIGSTVDNYKRRIINVNDGINDTDAVTVGQLNAIITALRTELGI